TAPPRVNRLETASRKGREFGLSGMRGNSLVPFLEGLRAATPSDYSAGRWKRAEFRIPPGSPGRSERHQYLAGGLLHPLLGRPYPPPFTSRFFIKRPPEPGEPWTSCSSFWEPRAWLARVPARSDPAPAHHRGSTCRQS